jgi:hypothetical protein
MRRDNSEIASVVPLPLIVKDVSAKKSINESIDDVKSKQPKQSPLINLKQDGN